MTSPTSSHLLVALQFSAIAVGIIPWGTPDSPAYLLISATGGLIGIYTLMHNKLGNFSVYPEPIDRAQLITSGPYRLVRHPMYLALLLFMLGIVLYNASVWNYLAMPLLLIAILGKINKEEAYLRRKFGGYSAYCDCSRRLLPFIY